MEPIAQNEPSTIETKENLKAMVHQWIDDQFDCIYEKYVESVNNIDTYGKKMYELDPDNWIRLQGCKSYMREESQKNISVSLLYLMALDRVYFWEDAYILRWGKR